MLYFFYQICCPVLFQLPLQILCMTDFILFFSSGMESSYVAWEAEQERNKKAALEAA